MASNQKEVQEHVTVNAQHVAEALRTDHFFIEESLDGTLNAELMDKAQAKADALDFDVFVVAVDTPRVDSDYVSQVAEASGSDGVYIVINGGSDLKTDMSFDGQQELQSQIVDQYSNAQDGWNHTSPSTTKLNILLDLYAQPEARKDENTGTGQDAPGSEVQTVDSAGSPAAMFLGGAVLILALVIAGVYLSRTLRQRAASKRSQEQFQLPDRLLNRVDSLQRESLRETLNSDTTRLAEEIESLRTQDLDSASVAKVQRGLDAYQIARRIVDDKASERIDLAGAMVLLRQAGREIADVGAGRTRTRRSSVGGGLPQSLCTINPLHGEAQSTTRVDADGSSVRMPVCSSCLQDLRSGNQLQWIFDGDRPYVEGSSVWAQTLFGAIGSDLVTALHRTGR